MTNALFAQAKAVVSDEDQTVDNSGIEFGPHPAGLTQARFIGYVECGNRPQSFEGQAKADAQEVRMYFELNGKKHRNEVDGKVFTNVQSERLTKKFGDKATFRKLFNKMTYGRPGITHMKDMLGEDFLITIQHNTVPAADGKKAKTFANMRDGEGTWLIQGPFQTVMNDDGEEVRKAFPAPAMTQPAKLLLWDNPSKEQWDSLFIDGTRETKDDKGNVTQVSKNWLQEDILTKATDLQGSALEALLGGVADLTLDDDVPDDLPDEPVAPKTPAAEPKQTKQVAASATDDVLADLGLDDDEIPF
jgi:hypothetical protein